MDFSFFFFEFCEMERLFAYFLDSFITVWFFLLFFAWKRRNRTLESSVCVCWVLSIDFDEERVLCSEERTNRTKNMLLIRGGIIAYVFCIICSIRELQPFRFTCSCRFLTCLHLQIQTNKKENAILFSLWMMISLCLVFTL